MESTGFDEIRGLTYENFKDFILGHPMLIGYEQDSRENITDSANRRPSIAPGMKT